MHECLITPYLQQVFTPEHIDAGVAAGSTRAALTLHFAKQHNAADIAAKEGTQVKALR